MLDVLEFLLLPRYRWSPIAGALTVIIAALWTAFATYYAWTNYADRVNARIVAQNPACALSWRQGRGARVQGAAQSCDGPGFRAELAVHPAARTVRGRLLDVVFDDRSGRRNRGQVFLDDEAWGDHPRGDTVRLAYHPDRSPALEPERGFLLALAGILGWPLLGLLVLALEVAHWREWMREA